MAGSIAVFCPLCLSSLWRNGSSLRFPRSYPISSENKRGPRGDLAINRSILDTRAVRKEGKKGQPVERNVLDLPGRRPKNKCPPTLCFMTLWGICSKEEHFCIIRYFLPLQFHSFSFHLPLSVLRLDLFATLVPSCHSSPECPLLFCWDRITYLFTTQNRVILLVFE